MTVEQTLAELVAIDSVSSRSNAAIISYLRQRCEAHGLTVHEYPHMDAKGETKINLVAHTSVGDPTYKSESQAEACATFELALVGHTDTVPYDSTWTDALKLTEADGKLFGRGACDTKAFIAAALTAIENCDLEKLKQPLALVFTCDEEIGCLGAKRLAEAKSFRARYAIVGEPTSLQPMRAGKGYCLAEITVHGREAHSAYPHLGSSAITRAADLIGAIDGVAERIRSDRHDAFDPPYTTLNVGLINGGTAKNVVAGECRFTLEWRTIPGQPTDQVLNIVREVVKETCEGGQDFSCDIDAGRFDESFETDAASELVQFLEHASAKPSGTVAFGTEAPSMIALGAEAVVFGPGDIRVAHRTGEFVPIAELNKCVEILCRSIETFCM
ncbi:MAG TPA: acetylornithine deacetylase [Pyrinomonadaceae bacterium]|jgi:acetylornithine deacetylase|nr:acetylornithine deacetylase [Pyrinomonadaceae bacterium]